RMDTRLKVFKAVADQLSYTRAARVMRIFFPGVKIRKALIFRRKPQLNSYQPKDVCKKCAWTPD
ncbi:MAG: LysR family transcriptional regulator, partial [Bacteroidota bacterium]